MSHDEIYREIGGRMRALRKMLGLTQAQVSELSGIDSSFYGQIERGKNIPSLKTFLGIARALKIDPAELLPKKGKAAELPYVKAIDQILSGLRPSNKRLVLDTVRDLAQRLKK